MSFFKDFIFLFCCFSSVLSEQNDATYNKTAYQSSTLSEYGFVYKVEMAMDGDNLTCSATVPSSDPAWFIVDLGIPYQSGRLHMDVKVIEDEMHAAKKNVSNVTEYPELYQWHYKEEITVDEEKMHVLTMNDFDASSNPPNVSVHSICWTSDELERFNSIKKSRLCYTETNATSYRYVALWVPAGYQLKVYTFEFFEEPKSIALYKKVETHQISHYQINAEKAVDDDKETCSDLFYSWLVVDLGRPYLIGRVNLIVEVTSGYGGLSVMTMNDFDVRLNPPNPSNHNVCWKSDMIEIYGQFEKNVLCLTTIPYRYVALWTSSSLSVCDLQVFEATQDTTTSTTIATTTFPIETMNTTTTTNLTLTACDAGYWGPDCSRPCHCHARSACHYGTGRCDTGCEVGWRGDACDQKDEENQDEFLHLTWSFNGNLSIRSSGLKKGKHLFFKNRMPLLDWLQVGEKND